MCNIFCSHSYGKLCLDDDRFLYFYYEFIPWCKLKNGKIVIAVVNLTKELDLLLNQKYSNFLLVRISYKDISLFLQNKFVSQNINYINNNLYINYNDKSVKALPDFSNIFVLFLLYIASCFTFFPDLSILFSMLFMNVLYFMTNMFKQVIFIKGINNNCISNNISINSYKHDNIEYPMYTILVPLFYEVNVLKQLIIALNNIDYPEEKLDIKLILEDDDFQTLSMLNSMQLEDKFEIIIVPDNKPKTKPKACSYALLFARGQYITIYDAEDNPDCLQLKKVIYNFNRVDKNVACLQAKLNFYNHNNNCLSKLFAIEYSSLFDFILPGLEGLNIPIPLGGSSNHFRTDILKKLCAWDPYNVTEDADLGIRLASFGYKVKIIDSYTMEESPISLLVWLKQRTRWLKGYIQTYLVHARNIGDLYITTGLRGVILLQLFIGLPVMVFLFSLMLWCLFFFQLMGYLIVPKLLLLFTLINLCIGVSISMFQSYYVVKYKSWMKSKWYCIILYPCYWFLHAISTVRAVWQFFTRPYYWDKTEHGLNK